MTDVDGGAIALAKIELHELAARYYGAIDRRDWVALERCFSPAFRTSSLYPSLKAYEAGEPQGVSTGLAEVLHNSRATIEPLAQTHHMVGNCVAELDGKTGRLSHHVRAYHLGGGSKADMFLQSFSVGTLHCRLGDDGCKIEEIDYVVCLYRGTMDLFMPDGVTVAPEDLPMLRGG